MGWFEKKGKDGETIENGANRASLADLAKPSVTPPAPAEARAATGPQQPQAGHQASIFGETADIEGSVEGHGDVVLRGTVRGSIHVTGALVIEPSGRVQADVAAREVVNAGTVEGNIIAAERVRVAATGIVDGDIDAPSIVIDDGGGVEGFIQMEPPGGEDMDDEVDDFVPPPPVKGLRSSLPPKPAPAPAPAATPAAPTPAAPAPPPAVSHRVAPSQPGGAPATNAPGPGRALPADSTPARVPQPQAPESPGSRNGKDAALPGTDAALPGTDATLQSAPALTPEPRGFDGPLGGGDDTPPSTGPKL
jgi:cytoskeletal protein CcmA (bactofilin family)